VSSTTVDANPANNTSSVTVAVSASIPALSPFGLLLLAFAFALLGLGAITLKS
jgi:hypothetical protein